MAYFSWGPFHDFAIVITWILADQGVITLMVAEQGSYHTYGG
jgi:hypothetical protein